jgi:hypothetical protein
MVDGHQPVKPLGQILCADQFRHGAHPVLLSL